MAIKAASTSVRCVTSSLKESKCGGNILPMVFIDLMPEP